MNDEIYDKYKYIAQTMMGYGRIKQIWEAEDELKVSFNIYGIELFCHVHCSLEKENADSIIRRLKRMSNELDILYNDNELKLSPSELPGYLKTQLTSFSCNDYYMSTIESL